MLELTLHDSGYTLRFRRGLRVLVVAVLVFRLVVRTESGERTVEGEFEERVTYASISAVFRSETCDLISPCACVVHRYVWGV